MPDAPDAPVEHLRLLRADGAAVTGTFRQDGHTVVGQLASSAACANESVQRVHRQNITETHTNRSTAVTWAIVGGVFTAIGTGLLIASQSADKRVYCGTSSSGPKDGDQCNSASGILSDGGFGTLLGGLTIATTAGIYLLRKPQFEASDLPTQQTTRVTSPVVCGGTAGLAGLVLAVAPPGGGKWTGLVAGDGSLRIDINDKIPLPDRSVSVVVDAVPPSLAGLVTPNTVVGTLTLSGSHPEAASPKLFARR